MKALSPQSAWPKNRVEDFLVDCKAPIRVAATTPYGFPILCSLWYRYVDGKILCATQKDAVIARHLGRDGRCAFEISPNEPPYFGLRGRGRATISNEGAVDVLADLLSRYLGEGDSEFRSWLMNRADDEVCISIEPIWMTTWDYRDRMEA